MELEHVLWYLVPAASAVAGGAMLLWPAEMAKQNRDATDDSSPPSAAELRSTRSLGVIFVMAGVYLLYRMLGGTWGAGPPGDDFQVLF